MNVCFVRLLLLVKLVLTCLQITLGCDENLVDRIIIQKSSELVLMSS